MRAIKGSRASGKQGEYSITCSPGPGSALRVCAASATSAVDAIDAATASGSIPLRDAATVFEIIYLATLAPSWTSQPDL